MHPTMHPIKVAKKGKELTNVFHPLISWNSIGKAMKHLSVASIDVSVAIPNLKTEISLHIDQRIDEADV